eukprot:gnl/TRDRNA2_/TRDRNA2_48614_c0_seq1.p1 gnl/TRDRNA2_/TRDRNA2_48614_c0~~gnl/TRDRNA2_/TRDRNA2_48614_c0_seq1.p1  ORF type:complete len:373 (-),score=74.59 gnl/TRDRNA2_/TRDRNA2_48614_c0_seq1:99-1154(-)
MMRDVHMIVLLAAIVRTSAEDPWGWPPKSTGTIRYDVSGTAAWPLKATGTLTATLESSAGPLSGEMRSLAKLPVAAPAAPPAAPAPVKKKWNTMSWSTRAKTTTPAPAPAAAKPVLPVPEAAVAWEKKIGPATWGVKSGAVWPPKPIGSVSGSVETGVGKLSGEVQSSAVWPPQPSATLTLKNEVCSELKCSGFPVPKVTSMKMSKDFGKLSCSLKSDAALNAIAKIQRTMDSPIGDVCCTLESTAAWPTKPVGSVSLKKNLGGVCCNLEAKSTGALSCSFEAASTLLEPKTTAAPTTPKPWYRFDEESPDVLSRPAAMLVGFFVGTAFTLSAWRFGRQAVTSSSLPLLAA